MNNLRRTLGDSWVSDNVVDGFEAMPMERGDTLQWS